MLINIINESIQLPVALETHPTLGQEEEGGGGSFSCIHGIGPSAVEGLLRIKSYA